MSRSSKNRPSPPGAASLSPWIAVLALGCLILGASVSFTAHVQTTSDGGSHSTWAVYRPWKLILGNGPLVRREAGGALAASPSSPWCGRVAVEGSAPWGRWEGRIITCLHTPRLPVTPLPTAHKSSTKLEEIP